MSETEERRKSKETGESSSKKKSKPRRKLTIKDFALGESSQPYNQVDDVFVQGSPNLDPATSLGSKSTLAMDQDGEGYRIILGRPWLMAMQARQDWGTGMLELQPHKGAKKGKAIHIDLKDGKHESLDLETSVDKFSSSDYSTSKEESTITDDNDSSQAEIMEVVLTNLAMVRELLNARFIYPVEDSEWVSPVVVTPKKNGKWRVCVDYKPLNEATKRDHFPLPFQDEILNEVAGYERYTMCDGYSRYFQIRIVEEDKKKTTFVTPWGCFAYRVMPFGLTNAPATFQGFVTHVFQPFFGKSIRVFIDDFCIYISRVLHLEKVNEGLARLQSLGGQLNVDKCHIAESQVTSLGYTPYHLVFGKEAILPIEVQLESLKILATKNEGTPSDQLKQRILDLERLELDREMAIEHYATQAERCRQKFNEGLKDKDLKRGMLVLCYDNRFDMRKDKNFMPRWEGLYVIRKKYTNGSYRLQDISDKLPKTRVNGWRLKP
ncbi:hypothetical protein L7F22_011002 [Adiantum nelumboides]|nr:hypothetical protein [Adiantum nelumboides]